MNQMNAQYIYVRRAGVDGTTKRGLVVLKIVLAVIILIAATAMRAEAAWYYVSTTGDSENDGSITDPWDIESAFAGTDGAAVIAPGDTLWLRAGTYGSGGSEVFDCTLQGTQAKPITIRNYPGERAIINAGILADGASLWITLVGLEITNTSTTRDETRAHGFQCSARGTRVINCVFHDTGHPAIGFWGPVGDGGELYGNIIWGTGYYDSGTGENFGSAMYMQNVVEGTRRYVTDNIMFRNFTNNGKIWSIGGPSHGFQVEGNASFDTHLWNFLSHSNTVPGKDNNLIENYTWRADTDASLNVQWGYQSDEEYSCEIKDNYLVGGATTNGVLMVELYKDLVVTGNTIVGDTGSLLAEFQRDSDPIREVWNKNAYYKGNAPKPFEIDGDQTDTWDNWRLRTGFDSESTYSTSLPTGVKTFVRPNKYELGRGHVIIYNWDEDEDVDVDLSSILEVGDTYEIRDAQNYFGTLAGSGTYAGGTVSFPMDLTTLAQPVGTCNHIQWRYDRHTMPQFGVFVVQRTSAALPRVYIECADDGGENGTDPITFRVRRTGSLDDAITVKYAVTGGTAIAGSDYTVPSGSVELSTDDDSATFSITVTDDSASEDMEHVVVTLTADDDYEIDPVQKSASGGIVDDDGTSAHWKLDEGAGTITVDSCGNLPNGNAQYATWTYDGKFGAAMSFNGSGQRVPVPKVGLTNMSTYTVSAWIKTEDESGGKRDIYSEVYPAPHFFRVYTQDGTVGFQHKTMDGDYPGTMASGSYSAGINDGEWHHIAVVRRAQDEFYLYIDGTQRASDTTNGPKLVDLCQNSYIGCYSNSGGPEYTYFNGTIDDVRIYDRDLSTTEVGWLHNAPTVSITATDPTAHEFSGKTGTFTITRTGSTTSALTVNLGISGTATNGTDYSTISGTATIPSGYASVDVTVTPTNDTTNEEDETVVIGLTESTDYHVDDTDYVATVTIDDDDTGMLAHWKMDEGTGSYTADATGNKSDATVWGSWTTGQYGNAVSFNGTSSYVNVGSCGLGNRTTFSISAWFKTDEDTVEERDIYSERLNNYAHVRLLLNRSAVGELTFEVRDNDYYGAWTTATVSYQGDLCDDEWHHAVAVRRAAGEFELYLDGALVGTDTDNAPEAFSVNGCWIGLFSTVDSGVHRYFQGEIDDVRIYDYALSPAQVASLHGSPLEIVSISAIEDDVASESGDTAVFTIARDSSCVSAALTVNYDISGTATNGTDYSTLSGSVTISAGDTSATVTITPVDDIYSESDETVTLALSAGSYTIDTDADSDTATIADNEPGLLSHWKFDENWGYTAYDSAADRDLTFYGDWVTGVLNSGVYFDGVTGERAYVNNNPTGIGNMERYTVSAWFKTDNEDTDARDIFSENQDVVGNVRLFVNDGTAGKITFNHHDYTRDGAEIEYSGSVNDGSWHHVAVVRSADDNFTLYLDGSSVGTDTTNAPGWTDAKKIGVGIFNDPDGTTYFEGSVDEVRVYSGALSSFEVSLLAMQNTNTISVDATDDSASESGPGTGTFTITRTGSTSGDLRVSYTLSGTADNGDDYTTLQGAVVIESGQSTATVTVTPVDDGDTEGSETVVLTLSEGVYTVDSGNSSDTVTITDND